MYPITTHSTYHIKTHSTITSVNDIEDVIKKPENVDKTIYWALTISPKDLSNHPIEPLLKDCFPDKGDSLVYVIETGKNRLREHIHGIGRMKNKGRASINELKAIATRFQSQHSYISIKIHPCWYPLGWAEYMCKQAGREYDRHFIFPNTNTKTEWWWSMLQKLPSRSGLFQDIVHSNKATRSRDQKCY